MKILFPFGHAHPGGAQMSALRLADGLERLGHVCTFWLLRPGHFREILERNGRAHVFFDGKTKSPTTYLAMLRRIRALKPDIVYLHASRLLAPPIRAMKIPVVERINMSRIPEAEGCVGNAVIDRFMTGLSSHLIAVSRAIAEQLLAHGVSAKKITVIRNGVDRDIFRPLVCRAVTRARLGIPHDAELVVNVGRLERQKAQADFVKAAAIVKTRRKNAFFVVFGRGSLEPELRELAQSVNISECLRFIGHEERMAEVYSSADVMLHTARWEPLANVIIEALACGLPVVATNVDGTSEAVRDGATGILVPPGEPAISAAAVVELLAAPSLRKSMAERAVEDIAERFSIERFVREHEALFARLTGK